MDLQPLLSKEKKDAKSLVVNVLSGEFPLHAKQIYLRIAKDNPTLSLTYQAVHKALGQLEADGVLVRLGGGYRMSPSWVESIVKFGHEVYSVYSVDKRVYLPDIPLNQSVTVEFSSDKVLVEPYYWMLEKLVESQQKFNQHPDPRIWQYNGWALTVLSDEKYKQFQALFEEGTGRLICANNLATNVVLAKMWEQFGFQARIGIPLPGDCELMAMWDYAFQIYHPAKTLRIWDDYYNKIEQSKLQDLSLTQKFAFRTKTVATVVITHNKEFANNIRSQVDRYFK